MQAIRFRGLVQVTQRLREQLARPVAEQQLSDIRRWVKSAMAAVEQALVEREANASNLAARSRRAYEFLRRLDAEGYPHHSASALGVPAAEPLRLPQLERFWRQILRCMAFSHAAYDDKSYAALCELSAEVERNISRTETTRSWLDGQTQAIRGWLRYFARRDRYDAYRAAMARARPPLEEAISVHRPEGTSFWISFQPVTGLFSARRKGPVLRLMLPTPMVNLDTANFEQLAAATFAGGERDALRAALRAPECQAIQAELDALGAEGLAQPVEQV
jgi:hypothetical protein